MKRLFLLFTALFIVLSLSACDLFSPTVVEEISEQYCRENPESEICKGDAVGDLETDAVINVFNTILSEYNDTTNTSFCTDYFSITNLELLDACRANRNDFFPEDVTAYTIESVTKKTTLSTEDVYEVVILSPNELTKYTFAIGLVKVEGIMYIESWEYTMETLDPSTKTMTLEIAKEYFIKFLADYTNPNITTAVICDTYFSQFESGCEEDRDGDIASNLVAALVSFVEQDGLYVATITLTYGSNTETQTLKLEFKYDELGNVQMIFQSDGEQIDDYTYNDYVLFIQNLFDDFFNSSRLPEDICNEYFHADQYDFCMDGYAQKELEGYTQTVQSLDPFEDHYKLVILTTKPGETPEEMTIEVYFYVDEDGLYIVMDVDNEQSDEYDTYYNFIISMLNDYKNNTISDAIFCDTYLGDSSLDCAVGRTDFLQGSGEVVLLNLYQDNFGKWFIQLEFEINGVITEQTNHVIFFYDNNNELKVSLEETMNDFSTYYDFIQDLVNQFQNSTLSSSEVCNYFFTVDDAAGCINERDNNYDFSYSIAINEFIPLEDGRFLLKLYYENTNNNYIQEMKVIFFFDENGNQKISFDDGNQQDPEFYQFVEDMILAFTNSSLSTNDFCQQFFDPNNQLECQEHRNNYDFAYTMTLVEFHPFDMYGSYKAVFKYQNGTDEYTEEIIVSFSRNQNNELYISFVPLHFDIEWDVAQQYLDQFVAKFNDTSISDNDFVTMFILPGSRDMFIQFRQDQLGNNMAITYYWLNFEYGKYSIGFEINNDQKYFYDVHFEYIDDVLLADYFPQSNQAITYDVVWNLISALTNEINTNQLPENICSTYFSFDSYQRCLQEVQSLQNNNVIVNVTSIVDNNGMWVLELAFNYPDSTVDTIYWDILFFIDENGSIRIEFTQNDTISPDEKLNFINIFTTEFNSFAFTATDFCNQYVGSDSQPDCIALYNDLMANQQELNWYFYEFYYNPNFIEFAVYDDATNEIVYFIRYDVKFYQNDSTNDIQMNLWNPQKYIRISNTEAEAIIQMIFNELNNTTISDDAFCNQYGYLMIDCYQLRGYIQSGETISPTTIDGDAESMYNVLAKRYASDNTLMQDYQFFFEIFEDLSGEPIIHGWMEDPYQNTFDLNQVTIAYTQFISDYFNPNYTDEEFKLMYLESYHQYDVEYRQSLLQLGYTVHVEEVYHLTGPNGFTFFEAKIKRTLNGVEDFIYLQFDAFYRDDNTIAVFPLVNVYAPDIAFITVLGNLFISDISNPGITNEEFCSTYFNPYDFRLCEMIRAQVVQNNYILTLGSTYHDDHYSEMMIDFYDSTNNYIDSIVFGIDVQQDMLGFDHVSLFIQFDQAIWNQTIFFMDNIVTSIRNGSLSIADLCTMYDCNGIWEANSNIINEVYYMYVDYQFEDIFNPVFRSEIYLKYNDGTYEYVTFELTYSIDSDNVITYYLKVIELDVSAPLNMPILDEANTLNVLQQFIIDVLDSSITEQDLCNQYFAGVLMTEDCIGGRNEMLINQPIITISPLQMGQDEFGQDMYIVTITMNDNGVIEESEMGIRIYSIDVNTYFIEFISLQPNIQPN